MFRFFRKSKDWKVHFERGMDMGRTNRLEKAAAAFREAITLAPDEPHPHYELGYTLVLMSQFEEALKEFRRTDELARGFFLVQTEIYLCDQMLTRAITPETFAQLRQLQMLMDMGAPQSEQAESLARKAVASSPDCALAHYYLGKALFDRLPAESEKALRRCLELHPDETTLIYAQFHVGSLLKGAGKSDEGMQMWRDIVAKYPANTHTRMVEAMAKRN